MQKMLRKDYSRGRETRDATLTGSRCCASPGSWDIRVGLRSILLIHHCFRDFEGACLLQPVSCCNCTDLMSGTAIRLLC